MAAAFLVAVFHFTWLNENGASLPPIGWVGVQIFFVLSGFVISGSAEKSTVRAFTINRLLRLYPTAWICIALSIVAIISVQKIDSSLSIHASVSPSKLMQSFTLLGNEFISSAYWTLQVELAFYLLIIIKKKFLPSMDLAGIAFFLIAWTTIYTVYTIGSVAAGHSIDMSFSILNMSLLRYGVYFAIGILLWKMSRKGLGRLETVFLAIAFVDAAIEIHLRSAHIVNWASGQHSLQSVFFLSLFIWLAAVGAISLAPYLSRINNGRVAKIVRYLGLMTYPLYLLHEAVGGAAATLLLRAGFQPATQVIAALIAAIVLSLVVSIWLEPLVRRTLARWAILQTSPTASTT